MRDFPDGEAPIGSPFGGSDLAGVIQRAHELTHATGCGAIAPAHLWLAILKQRDSRAVQVLSKTGIMLDDLEKALLAGIRSDEVTRAARPRFTSQSRRALNRAKIEVARLGSQSIGSEHLLLALLGEAEGRISATRQFLKLSPPADETIAKALRKSGLWDLGFDTDFLRQKMNRELWGAGILNARYKQRMKDKATYFACFTFAPYCLMNSRYYFATSTSSNKLIDIFQQRSAWSFQIVSLLGLVAAGYVLLSNRFISHRKFAYTYVAGFAAAQLLATLFDWLMGR